HKTGSGFREESGLLTAHNDVAVVTLPDGSRYTLAVLVKDFRGSESQAAEVIAGISAAVYSALSQA
ncbi:MAG: CfxA family class A broad-spectrum beta-lactamase, partial [Muribaculaceae bacterium]|nr:CfxA family class A broad-spectrum beta-lactamase [Muribaculaceae bacterium]